MIDLTDEMRAEMRKAAAAAAKGKWRVGPYDLDILAPCEKGLGETKLFDIRGWGYYTGKGHGALGLSDEEGRARQAANGKHVALSCPANLLALLDALDRSEARADKAEKELEELAVASDRLIRAGQAAKAALVECQDQRDAERERTREMAETLEPIVASFMCSSGSIDEYGGQRIPGQFLEHATRVLAGYCKTAK